jgi:hypothetical protein
MNSTSLFWYELDLLYFTLSWYCELDLLYFILCWFCELDLLYFILCWYCELDLLYFICEQTALRSYILYCVDFVNRLPYGAIFYTVLILWTDCLTELYFILCWFCGQTALRSVPGAEHQLLRQHRLEADCSCQRYLEKKCRANKELRWEGSPNISNTARWGGSPESQSPISPILPGIWSRDLGIPITYSFSIFT